MATLDIDIRDIEFDGDDDEREYFLHTLLSEMSLGSIKTALQKTAYKEPKEPELTLEELLKLVLKELEK